jgi:hypothetical protein
LPSVLSVFRYYYGQKRFYQESNDGSCGSASATATLQTMNMMFEMMNMPVMTSQYWNIAYVAGKGEAKPQKIPTVLWWGFTFSEIQVF